MIPEAPRYLMVLEPIERAIQKHYSDRRIENPLYRWDRPFGKWEFPKIWEEYIKWYREEGKSKRETHPIDWKDTMD